MNLTASNDNPDEQAKAVTRAIVNSLSKMEGVQGVSPEVALEGLVKAAAVYALDKLGSTASVADMFQAFAMTIRELPPQKYDDLN